jgi:adenine deaminase
LYSFYCNKFLNSQLKTYANQIQLHQYFESRKFILQKLLENGKIKSIEKIDETIETYILPGFVDAHVHIESSMLVPTEFAKKQ